ncbi:hypothetical protein DSL92_07455 [Billgrantia gudaonensis]|uniref:Uncharacterized protein n=1 Tax=Billgrantia gudaonensis TaxID=376427 RepID=A0A3S0NEI6_9GAMM|nr:hypothetical protein DSL92_07455 [Halomonas gudaonensis]
MAGTAGAAGDLLEQLGTVLQGTKVAGVETGVGVDHDHQRHMGQMVALWRYLGARETGFATPHLGEHPFQGIATRVLSRSMRCTGTCGNCAVASPRCVRCHCPVNKISAAAGRARRSGGARRLSQWWQASRGGWRCSVSRASQWSHSASQPQALASQRQAEKPRRLMNTST